jgi:hypothetical protein
MAAPLSYLYLTRTRILTTHFTNVSPLLSIASVWLLLEYGTEVVRFSRSVSLTLCSRIFPCARTGNPSDTYLKCLDEVQSISCGTLFSPVTRNEVVQSMSKRLSCDTENVPNIFPVLVAGWSDNGWLSGGHAVRMAMELCKLDASGQ